MPFAPARSGSIHRTPGGRTTGVPLKSDRWTWTETSELRAGYHPWPTSRCATGPLRLADPAFGDRLVRATGRYDVETSMLQNALVYRLSRRGILSGLSSAVLPTTLLLACQAQSANSSADAGVNQPLRDGASPLF